MTRALSSASITGMRQEQGWEQRAKQQRLLLEQASADGGTTAPKRHVL